MTIDSRSERVEDFTAWLRTPGRDTAGSGAAVTERPARAETTQTGTEAEEAK
jgi:hypothetical protein